MSEVARELNWAGTYTYGAPATGAAPQARAGDFLDDFSELRLGERWTFRAPSAGEPARATLDEGLVLRGKGTSPSDTSPLTIVVGDHSYEVEVDVELLGDCVEGGLLLFFSNKLFCGIGIDGRGMPTYFGGHGGHWKEPAPPARRLQLRIRNDQHIVTSWYRAPGEEWTRHQLRWETSGYHANTMGDLLSLRPSIYAVGDGAVRFRHFRYTVL